MSGVGVGFTLQPDEEFLALCAALLEHADYAELAPETLWRRRDDGAFVENGFHVEVGRIVDRAGVAVVSHGVGLSLGTLDDADEPRLSAWLARLAKDAARFRFRWASDHLGATHIGGLHLQLPVPVPMTAAHAAATRRRLARLAAAVGAPAAVETTANHFVLGDPLDEPAFVAACTEGAGVVLDLHNVWTMAQNLGFDVDAYLSRLPLDRVVEIHVSGGSESDPRWLPSGRSVRLDSHDGAVPEAVWSLLAAWAPRCPRLQGVTLERMEGTVDDDTVPLLREELARVRKLVDTLAAAALPPVADNRPAAASVQVARPRSLDERAYAEALCASDPAAALTALGAVVDEDGARVTGLLVAKLRFERVIQGSRAAAARFHEDPAGFAAAFRRYHAAVAPTALTPAEEAAAFLGFA